MGQCYNSCVVPRPADHVWRTLRNFHDLAWAAGVVTRADRVGDLPGDRPGARRVLNGAFHETLLTLDDAARTFSYSIDDGPGPVAKDAVRNYVGTVRVAPVTDSDASFVEWISTYESADPAAVGALCNPVYQALLGALKKHLG